jgi:hypothetical protein
MPKNSQTFNYDNVTIEAIRVAEDITPRWDAYEIRILLPDGRIFTRSDTLHADYRKDPNAFLEAAYAQVERLVAAVKEPKRFVREDAEDAEDAGVSPRAAMTQARSIIALLHEPPGPGSLLRAARLLRSDYVRTIGAARPRLTTEQLMDTLTWLAPPPEEEPKEWFPRKPKA